ncbi:GyrI-like domain-containing protein [Poseidonibacter ostreae]|uniref:AraC family transcriptional regulator n=1 Tax=Poseidonibacter ostreae TaxID=2654171 RepID=A0A6L4WTK8_9BACT|nr:GyrI-like domain-containing protein [Poseidonibacter ostreae]KAB7887066.1 AraC family transcriptional regulator [Poseidonibacter ostreae]KAB7889210.1 AraC family transcriptional regulator [Poseidonibacter ostreae]KAB7891589.1 AraC family transcriptional regulator [Poseidonibacter ostreae]MAC84812.1 AraC family transcriptional regulator [Arcobacter sp.]
MKTKRIRKLMISGISVTTNNKNEMNEETAKIATLWDDYSENSVYSATHDKANNSSMYGVYSNYTSDVNGDYDVTVGVEVTKNKKAIVIEDEKYLVFKKEGELPQVVIDTWKEIWDYFENNDEYKRKYSIDFEHYTKEDEIEIYISIEK